MVSLQIDPEIQWYMDNHLTHQLHTSERKAFRACRRRWNWVYNHMYHPTTTPEPLEFGIAFHKAMETFYEPRTWHSDVTLRTNLAKMAFKLECDKHLRDYKKLNPDPDPEVLASYKSRIELGLNMIDHYCLKFSPRYDTDWTPLRVEVSFEVPIKHPETDQQIWCKCIRCARAWTKHTGQVPRDDPYLLHSDWRGLPVTYGGRLDALFQDSHGRYWIADWKTTSRLLDEDAEASFLQLDDQVVSYLWALSQLGIDCAGFIYVEIKKAYPQPPEVLTRAYKGKFVSTNKQNLTTYDMALDVIKRHDFAAYHKGEYKEYLNWLKMSGPRFTERHQVHKNPYEIAEAGRVIAYEALDMINNPNVYPQPGRFSCNWCLFKQPCLGKNMGEDYLYTLNSMFEKKTLLYWQEKEASTE